MKTTFILLLIISINQLMQAQPTLTLQVFTAKNYLIFNENKQFKATYDGGFSFRSYGVGGRLHISKIAIYLDLGFGSGSRRDQLDNAYFGYQEFNFGPGILITDGPQLRLYAGVGLCMQYYRQAASPWLTSGNTFLLNFKAGGGFDVFKKISVFIEADLQCAPFGSFDTSFDKAFLFAISSGLRYRFPRKAAHDELSL